MSEVDQAPKKSTTGATPTVVPNPATSASQNATSKQATAKAASSSRATSANPRTPTDESDEAIISASVSLGPDEKLGFPRYDGKEFSVWRMKVESFLRYKEIYDVLVKGKPRRRADASEAEKQQKEAQILAYEKADRYVKSLILLSLDNKEAKLVLKCNTAKDMWSRLTAAHEQRSSANKIILQKEFFDLNMKSDEKVQDFVARAEYLYGQLEDIGVKGIDESVLVSKIVSGLPRRYLNFMSNWSSLDSKHQTLVELMARLSAEEHLLDRFRKPAENALSAEFKKMNLSAQKNEPKHPAKPGEQSSTPKSKNSRNKRCRACNRRGHNTSECRNKSVSSSTPAKAVKKEEGQIVEGSLMVEEGGHFIEDSLWIVDTGATSHMSFDRNDFSDYREFEDDMAIKFGGRQTGHAAGIGTVKFLTKVAGQVRLVTLNKVLHVPELRRRLISVSAATQMGCRGEFADSRLVIRDPRGLVLISALKVNKLYVLKTYHPSESACVAADEAVVTWHERFCHINQKYLLETSKVVEGLESLQNTTIARKGVRKEIDCIGCCIGKQPRNSAILRETPRATEVGEVLHVDIGGPVGCLSLSSNEYYIIFKDEYSNYRFLSSMKSRDEAFDILRKVVARIFAETKKAVRYLMSDCGSEFTSKRTQEFLVQQKIVHRTAAPFTPAQNGFIERENRTLMSGVRAMLHHRRVPLKFWAEAACTMVYVLNRTVNRNTSPRTPFELYFEKKPKVGHFRVFGSLALIKVQNKKRSGYQKKVEERAIKGVLIGYEQDYTYRVYDPDNNKVVVTRDVLIDESKSYFDTQPDYTLLDNIIDPASEGTIVDADAVEQADVVEITEAEPETYKQAISSQDSDKWLAAMRDEYNSLLENKTWDLVSLPKDRKAVACKWVFKLKFSVSGEIERYKARLVAKGFTQREGIDYKDTFSPVVRLETVRLLLVIANQLNLDIIQMDVKTAFLNGELEEEIFMKQPEGFHQGESQTVCRLKKSIYGLKQASLQWNKCFTSFLRQFNLRPLKSDACVFVNTNCNLSTEGPLLIVCIYVDDGLIMSNASKLLHDCVDHLQSRFEIKTSEPNSFVGIQIRRERGKGKLFLSQGLYIRRLLERYGLSESTPLPTPMDSKLKLDKNGAIGVPSKEVTVPYRQLLGSLLYASSATRPDITFSVNTLARYSDCTKLVHWAALKRVAKYLRGKEEMGLVNVRREEGFTVECYSDADYASCVETRKSVSGYILLFNKTPVLWKAAKQTIVATSTCEAEFVSAAAAAKEVIWLRNLLSELGLSLPPTPHYIDNLGTVQLIENDQVHAKTKHLDIKLFFIRDINRKQVEVRHVSTELQLGDILTKPLARDKFESFLKQINIVDCERLYHSEMNVAAIALLCVASWPVQSACGSDHSVARISLYVTSPCPEFVKAINRIEMPTIPAVGKIPAYDYLMYKKYTGAICELQYGNILRAVNEVEICLGHSRPKRQVSNMLEIASDFVKVGVTNLVASQFKRSSLLGLSDIASLFTRLSQATIDALFNNPLDSKVNDIKEVSPSAKLHETETREAATLIPALTWLESYAHEEMVAGVANLRSIAKYCRAGQLGTIEVAEMLGDPTLSTVKPEDTLLDQVHVSKQNGSVLIEFTFSIKHHNYTFWILTGGAITSVGTLLAIAFLAYRNLVQYRLPEQRLRDYSSRSTLGVNRQEELGLTDLRREVVCSHASLARTHLPNHQNSGNLVEDSFQLDQFAGTMRSTTSFAGASSRG